ncbi:MAG: ATP-binding protein [Nitrosomonas sp.]|uniref:AAA family ATPase n=1 Tax=Nitrosomonas sp. TaxID=42353 RepID=UPI0032EF1ECA
MRLTSLYIGQYKNLRDFELSFDGSSFIDVFVGKNGTGKSNLFEALIEIFRHLDQFDRSSNEIAFDYKINYEIDGHKVEIEWKDAKLRINEDVDRKTLGKTPFPQNVVVYYSGHNSTVARLVARYEKAFRRRIYRGLKPDDSRLFIGVGSDYKALFLAVLLMHLEENAAKNYLKKRLGIAAISSELEVKLKRPFNAKARLKAFDVDEFDPLRTDTRYWGADKVTQEFIDELINCVNSKDGFNIAELYDRKQECYCFKIDLDLFHKRFKGISASELFRKFDNLKTLDMLADIRLPLILANGESGDIAYFSDGQFQSVYIYSIVELFKDRNCITLLDEPDSFLHPEWQFDFLKQIFEITDTAAKNNHVLMSSHSASTIISANENMINLFEIADQRVTVIKRKRSDIIKSLSAGMITFTENEARLNIAHVLNSTSGAVLFTEGITDELIIENAWKKLFPEAPRLFEVQNAFDRIFLRNLFSREEIQKNHPGRTMFALFDFDEAYDDWNGLKKRRDECTDPFKGLCKQLTYDYHYAMLLPIPDNAELKPQALKLDDTPWGRGSDSHISIEHLFYGTAPDDNWFTKEITSCGGQRIQFTGDKVKFAKEVVPILDPACFEVFRPMFEFIKSKCQVSVVDKKI